MPSRVRSRLSAPLGAALFLIAVLSASVPSSLLAQPAGINIASQVDKGRAIFLDERKGNCAACHKAPNDSAVKTKSNIGMPLEAVKARYPDRAKLRDAIWDISKSTPNTIMPPYGKNRILSDDEIDALVIYLETI
jgi:L-cysteine S-thiosulfotransferase